MMHRLVCFLLVLCIVLTSACAPSSSRVIRIVSAPEFVQDANWEISTLMSQLGYRHLDILDPSTEQPVAVVSEHGEYRMLFSAIDDPSLRVVVYIGIGESKGRLVFYRKGQKTLDERARARYETLVDSIQEVFGQDNVVPDAR